MTRQQTKQILIQVLAVIAVLFGGSMAASAVTKTADFNSGLPEGWSLVGNVNNNSDRARTGKSIWSNGKSETANYLVTEAIEGSLSLYWRSYGTSSSYPNGYLCVYQYDGSALGTLIQKTTTYKSSTWKQESFDLGTYHGQVAIALYSACIDDVTYTPYVASEEPTLEVADYATGSTYDFGTVSEGTTKTFTLNNTGKAALTVSSVSVTGGFVITEGADLQTINAQSSAQVTVKTPAVDAEGQLTIVSNDAKSPYVLNLKSTYRAPAPLMGIDMTSVNFGRVTANATQDITVSNTGDAELSVTIASSSDDFTVSKSQLTVAAGAQEVFTITYVYNAEAYGVHSATITVTPAEGQGEAATIAASAYVKDPTTWSEDFEGNKLPDGWKADDCWTFSDGVAHSKYEYGTVAYLTTPALTVATGESMTFQYKATANNVKIKIQLSKNGGEFSDYQSTDWINKMDDFATFTIEGLEAGSYQFRFQNDDYDLDNFEGFRLNQDAPVLVVSPVADAAFGKVTAQPEAKTYTITNDGTGTLTGTITSSDETLFTVSKADFSLTAGESTTFDVALVFSETYGDKAATITIHPTNEGLSDVVINATATTLDPNVWVEDFNEGVMPEGWTNTSWTVGTMTGYDNNTPMALAPQSTTASTLITPCLQAKKDDVLTWDAYLRWSDEALLVEYSSDDQATWTTIYDYKAADESLGDRSYKAMSFTAPADGNYYLRFTSKYQNGIDNLCGFQLAPSTAVKETWHISYTFHYTDNNGEHADADVEDMDIEFDGDKVAFRFPNPFNQNAWLRGTKMDYDGPAAYLFPMGQYVGQYSGENIYFCGGANDTLSDMVFFYDADQQAFFNFEHVLLNGSTNAISLWAYFSDVVIYKDQMPVISDGISHVGSKKEATSSDVIYDLQGRRVQNVKKGLYIINGKKCFMK